MSNKYKKVIATGLASNMVLMNVPYNVFANSDIIEETFLNEDNSISEDSIINEDDFENNENNYNEDLTSEDLIISETIDNEVEENISDCTEIKNSTSNISEDDNFESLEINEIENSTDEINNYLEPIEKEVAEINKTVSPKLVTIPNVLNYASNFAGGNGSQENPYQISNPRELARLAYLVNETDFDTTGVYFELTADIDLNGFDADNDTSNGNWIPIGCFMQNKTYAFKGAFNGNNHTISNMQIDGIEIYAGLFGVVENAEFRDVVLDSFSIVDIPHGSALACYSKGNLTVEGVTVSDFMFDYNLIDDPDLPHAGVLSAYVNGVHLKDDNSIIIDNIDVRDSNININLNSVIRRNDRGGGLLGYVREINNVDITNSNIDICIQAGTIGGLIADFDSTNANSSQVNRMNIKNVDVNLREKRVDKAYCLGGILGKTFINVSDNSAFVIEDCNITIDSNSNSVQGEREYLGGVFGYISGGSKGALSSTKCINVNVDFVEKTVANCIGGIVGESCANYVLNIDKCNVNGDLFATMYCGGLAGKLINLDCNNFTYTGTMGGLGSNYTYVGGILGSTPSALSDKLNISNTHIKGDIIGDTVYAGGVCAYANLNNTAKFNDIVIEMDMVGQIIGGVVGYLRGSGLIIDNITIGNENDYVQLNYKNSKAIVKGVSAMIGCSDTDSITISNSNVYTNLDSKNTYGGGLIGSLNRGVATIDNVNIDGTLNGEDKLGGAIGYICDGDINISDLNINADIDNYDGGYSSDTGGFISYVNSSDVISIQDSSYTGNIRGGNNVGGVIGSSPVSEDTSTMDLSNIEVRANIENSKIGCVAGLIASTYYKNINISDVIFEGDITSNGYAGGLIGRGVANIDGARVVGNIVNLSNGDTAGVIGVSENGNSNMVLSNLDIEVTIDSKKSSATAGVVARNYAKGVIDNVTFNGSMNGNSFCAGIVANNSASSLTISNCDVTVDIGTNGISGGICAYSTTSDVIIEGNKVRGSIDTADTCGGVAGSVLYVKILDNIVTMDLNVRGTSYNNIGGIVGNVSGTQSVVIGNSFEGSVRGNYNVGGICGTVGNATEISKNISKATINGQNNVGGMFGSVSYNTIFTNNAFIGSVEGTNRVGGIIGSISVGSGTDVEMSNSYTASTINGQTDVNNIIGYINNATLTTDNVYYDNVLSPSDDVYGIGLSTEQMMGYNTYDNMDFDFDTIWFANKDFYPTFEQINTAPEIEGEDIELIQNQEYDLLDYVTVEDFEDKDLIPEIVTDLDITKIGEYTATFIVTDPEGLSDELTLNIKVVMENPIINASNIEIYKGEKFDPRKDVTAIDVDGTDITEHIKIIENTVNTQEVGEYKVVYEVSSLYKSTIQKEVKVTVKEKQVVDEEEKPDIPNPDKDEKPNNSKPEEDKDKDKKPSNNTNKPQTGDNIMIYGLSLMMSLAGLFSTNRKNKYK